MCQCLSTPHGRTRGKCCEVRLVSLGIGIILGFISGTTVTFQIVKPNRLWKRLPVATTSFTTPHVVSQHFFEEAEENDTDDAEIARTYWQLYWKRDFPGSKWGLEPRCASKIIAPPEFRHDWAAQVLKVAFNSSHPLVGVEIGACQLPITMPKSVTMRYIDMYADGDALKSQCFLKSGARLPDIVDDAQMLSRVGDESFDFLVAAHVLEHMPDVLGALRHWLRVVRQKRGLVMIILPDPCDHKFAFGDRFRLVARPDHFLGEFGDRPGGGGGQNASAQNFAHHCKEQGVSLAAVDFLRSLANKTLLGDCAYEFDTNPACAYAVQEILGSQFAVDHWSIPVLGAVRLKPERIRQGAQLCMRIPHNVHLHLWTVESMRAMLMAAQTSFQQLGVGFHIVDVRIGGRTQYNMQELRAVLRRI